MTQPVAHDQLPQVQPAPAVADVPPEPAPQACDRAPTRWWQLEQRPRRVSQAELMNFSRQTASFLRAGVPILDAFTVIAEENAKSRLAGVLGEVVTDLRRGATLSGAIGRHHDFPLYYVSMLRAAELTGRLDVVFDQLAGYLERELDAKRRLRSALTYPIIVMLLSLGSIGFLTVFVLPKFEDFFEEFDAELPLITRLLLGVVGFFTDFWPLIGAFAALLAAAGVVAGRTARGRVTRDRWVLALPLVGQIVQYSVVERFCRALAAMARAGVPLPDAMAVAANSTTNKVYEQALIDARAGMLRGDGLAGPIAATKAFPKGLTQMVRVGESTGTLDQQLLGAAVFYEKELDYRLKRFTDAFEPAVVLGVGLVVGVVALALVSAMYGIFGQAEL